MPEHRPRALAAGRSALETVEAPRRCPGVGLDEEVGRARRDGLVQGWLLASNSTAVSPVGPSHAAITGDLLDALLWHSPLAAVSAAAVALPAAPPSHHSMTTASYLPHRSATRLHCRSAAAATATVALLLRTAQLRLHCCRFAIAATPRRSAPAAATAPLRCGRVAQLLLSYSYSPPTALLLLRSSTLPRCSAPRRSASLCDMLPALHRAASLLPRCFAAAAPLCCHCA